MSDDVLVEIDDLNRPYWDSLADGKLSFQHCKECDNRWLPARQQCPRCLSADIDWQPSAGQGKLVSWVVYHTAYHPAFKDKLPYNVAIVELDEGPRLLSSIVDQKRTQMKSEALKADQRVKLALEKRGNINAPYFSPA